METGRTQNKLIVLGAAESGIGAALLAKKQGWDVFVSDGGTIQPAFRNELSEQGIPFEEGTHSLDRLTHADVIVKSPGIPEKAPVMKAIRAAGVKVCSEVEFAYWYKGNAKIIAITGSNGKTTTTSLIFSMLEHAGYNVSCVGNIGFSFARQVAQQPTDWYVLEVSSFQLDDIHSFRPDIAVLLNITPDHLDRYEYKFENYVASKFRITAFQTENDNFITNRDDQVIMDYLKTHTTNSKKLFFTMNEYNLNQDEDGAAITNGEMNIMFDGEQVNASIYDMTIKGKHNYYNSMAAGISGRVAGIRKGSIRESLVGFKGVEHRLEPVAIIRGVEFVNDSKATNVNSTWYALESADKPVVLIMGGLDKGNDYSELLDLVREKVKAIVCLGIDNTPIHNFFEGEVANIVDTTSMNDAVRAACMFAVSGDQVLLSPACASFDLFRNYEERGRQFKEVVRAL